MLEVLRLLENRRAQGWETRFYWIPAHKGVPGNELADTMAKQATGWRATGPYGPKAPPLDGRPAPPLRSAVDRWIRGSSWEEWKDRWQRAGPDAPGGQLRQLLPTVDRRTPALYQGLTRAESSALVQARTGKIGLNEWLHSVRRADSERCPCGSGAETVFHVLLRCRLYQDQRRRLWGDAQTLPANLAEALGDPTQARRSAALLLGTGRLRYLLPPAAPEALRDASPTVY